MTLRNVIAGILLSFAATAPTLAQAAVKHPIDIPQQQLGSALTELAKQTRIQVVYTTDLVEGRRTNALSGTLTPEEALDQLLSKTGLRYEFVDAQTVTLSREGGASTRPATPVEATTAREAQKSSFWDRFRLAQVDQGNDSDSSAVSSTKPIQLEEVVVNLPEILVVGSKILNMDIRRTRDDVQPYQVFDRESIDRSGARNVGDFLRQRAPALSMPVTATQNSGSSNLSSGTLNLRGLGAEQTLLLVDGHRIASVGLSGIAGQPDLNGIPLSAIERIELLPATASGIYGGGATGGVINVILRRGYTGLDTKLTYENTFDSAAATRRVDLNAGVSLGEKTTVLLAGSYSSADELLASDRDLIERGREHILANNPGAILSPLAAPILGSTTNIRSVPGTLTLKPQYGGTALDSRFTFVPAGYSGAASDNGAGLVANAGRYNLALADTAQTNGGGDTSLLSGPTVKSLMMSVRQELTPRLQAFLDLSASSNDGSAVRNAIASSFLVPGASAANPFVEDVFVTTPALGTDQRVSTSVRDVRAVGGLIFRISSRWYAEVDYTWNRNRYEDELASNALGQTVGGLTASQAVANGDLNVFRDTSEFPIDFLPFASPGSVVQPSHTKLQDAALRVGGTLGWSLPAGAPTLTMLLEHRKESLGIQRNHAGGLASATPHMRRTRRQGFLPETADGSSPMAR